VQWLTPARSDASKVDTHGAHTQAVLAQIADQSLLHYGGGWSVQKLPSNRVAVQEVFRIVVFGNEQGFEEIAE
jgi:hypothetical protein